MTYMTTTQNPATCKHQNAHFEGRRHLCCDDCNSYIDPATMQPVEAAPEVWEG